MKLRSPLRRPVPLAARVAVVAIGVAVLPGCGLRGGGSKPIPAFPVTFGEIVSTVDTSGQLEAAATTRVRAPANGTIVELLVDDGQTVTKGQPIARIDSPVVENQVVQAELLVAQMKAQAATAEASIIQTELMAEQQLMMSAFVDELKISLDALQTATDDSVDEVAEASATAASASDTAREVAAAIAALDDDEADAGAGGTASAEPAPDADAGTTDVAGAQVAALPEIGPIGPGPLPGLGPLPEPPTIPDIEDKIDEVIDELAAAIGEAVGEAMSEAIAPLLEELESLEESLEAGIDEIVAVTESSFEEIEAQLQDIEDQLVAAQQSLEEMSDDVQAAAQVVLDEYDEFLAESQASTQAAADEITRLLESSSEELVTVAEKQLALAREAEAGLVIVAPADGVVILGEETTAPAVTAGASPSLSATSGLGGASGASLGAGGLPLSTGGAGAPTGDLLGIGSPVSAGQPLVSLYELSSYRVSTTFDEFQIASVKEGMTTDVEIEALGLTCQGVIESISRVGRPGAAGTEFAADVRIFSDDGCKDDLRSGFSATVSVVGERFGPAPLVREAAIQREADKAFVWVVDDGIARRQEIEILGSDGIQAAVKGLEEGQAVALASAELEEGQSVEITLAA